MHLVEIRTGGPFLGGPLGGPFDTATEAFAALFMLGGPFFGGPVFGGPFVGGPFGGAPPIFGGPLGGGFAGESVEGFVCETSTAGKRACDKQVQQLKYASRSGLQQFAVPAEVPAAEREQVARSVLSLPPHHASLSPPRQLSPQLPLRQPAASLSPLRLLSRQLRLRQPAAVSVAPAPFRQF